ncbi:hypothetical protein SAMN04487785_10138 [Dyella jiangningensis]|uniref:hypothetical protein n=1 Tax=Dyella sp. AtDHG13 TaxID=1938897 RepID=UPI000890D4D7|nr:hypothetical protein [Dyella sp. AtDHG13]PXV59519.1 hypothetical protein BDW41_10349 [Dyella sp. AtDHG13]SDJ14925.1 hypothetical protein SAMN04487785_10138 [Dyella jiangningensis]
MQRLSSRWTFFHKRVFPVLWFGFLVFAVVLLVYQGVVSRQIGLFVAAILPLGFALFGATLFKRFVFDLADEVWLEGDHLLVRLGQRRSLIELSNVSDVETKMIQNPARVTLALRTPCFPFGEFISFVPVAAFSLWGVVGGDTVADEFMRRLSASRRSA